MLHIVERRGCWLWIQTCLAWILTLKQAERLYTSYSISRRFWISKYYDTDLKGMLQGFDEMLCVRRLAHCRRSIMVFSSGCGGRDWVCGQAGLPALTSW